MKETEMYIANWKKLVLKGYILEKVEMQRQEKVVARENRSSTGEVGGGKTILCMILSGWIRDIMYLVTQTKSEP